MATGRVLAGQLLHDRTINSAAFNADGNVVATWDNETVKVWDVASGRQLFADLRQPSEIQHVEFSQDGSRFVTCFANSTFAKCYAQIWSTATGLPIGPKLYHGDGVLYATFKTPAATIEKKHPPKRMPMITASNGSPMATPPSLRPRSLRGTSASRDRSIRVWNAEDGEPLTPPLRNLHESADASFVPGGLTLISSDYNGYARVWDLPVDRRPIEYLTKLARFLSGDTSKTWSSRDPSSQIPPQQVWEELRRRYPSDFNVSRQELIAWHDFEAKLNEARSQWLVAAFHLERLQRLCPDSPAVVLRLADARRNLNVSK